MRAARVLLDIEPKEFTALAGISKRSLSRLESNDPVGEDVRDRVQRALELKGVEFTEDGDGGIGLIVPKGVARKVGFQIDDWWKPKIP